MEKKEATRPLLSDGLLNGLSLYMINHLFMVILQKINLSRFSSYVTSPLSMYAVAGITYIVYILYKRLKYVTINCVIHMYFY
jgi:hypothetical protein